MIGLLAALVLATWAPGGPEGVPPEQPARVIELAPGLRVNRSTRVVEFEGTVPVDAHNADTPDVFLELLVTGPDSREHESLVVTRVPPSLIHAALLAVELTPGRPGSVTWQDDRARRTPATGDRVEVLVRVESGEGWSEPAPLASWVISQDRATRLVDDPGWSGLVFAGSTADPPRDVPYVADATGTIIGLATFGTEVIAPRLTLSHESRIDAPAWVANRERTPVRGTRVRVIIRPAKPGAPERDADQ